MMSQPDDVWIQIVPRSMRDGMPIELFGAAIAHSIGNSGLAELRQTFNLTGYIRHMIRNELGDEAIIQLSAGEVAEVRRV